MPRAKKPKALLVRHEINKKDKEELIELEKELSGGKDLLQYLPKEIENNETAIEYYEFILRELEVSDILSNLDIPLVVSVSICLARMYEANIHIDKVGQVYETEDKYGNLVIKKNPSVDIYNTFLTQFKTLSTQLGLSPSSRATLAELNIGKKEDAEDEVLKALRGE